MVSQVDGVEDQSTHHDSDTVFPNFPAPTFDLVQQDSHGEQRKITHEEQIFGKRKPLVPD